MSISSVHVILIFLVGYFVAIKDANANKAAAQLYEDLTYTYNRVVRPVKNVSEAVIVKFGASLIRIIDIDSRNQIFTTNLWLEIQWQDSKLVWDPNEYGGIKKLHMPADLIWLPDIVLYNNAAGQPEISIYTDALVYYDGTIVWKPPAIYKSFCAIDVLWFPYDEQNCWMKFGLWTHTGQYVDLRPLPEEDIRLIKEDDHDTQYLDVGMDLSYFYLNAEWDLLNLTGKRHEEVYSSCCGPETYVDITFYFKLRRKTLFYTINLIIPCALISFLTTFVFYLPADPLGHQLTFSISILVTLTVFFLVLIEMIPPTSLVIPLFGKYLLFTMLLVTLSIVISVVVVNLHHRTGSTHRMPGWVKRVFLDFLPKYLLMNRPVPEKQDEPPEQTATERKLAEFAERFLTDSELFRDTPYCVATANNFHNSMSSHTVGTPQPKPESYGTYVRRMHALLILRVIKNVQFISAHFKGLEEEDEISNDWTYVAMVIDRFFFVLFTLMNFAGTAVIILQAPTLYDTTSPMDRPLASRPLGGDTLGPHYTNA